MPVSARFSSLLLFRGFGALLGPLDWSLGHYQLSSCTAPHHTTEGRLREHVLPVFRLSLHLTDRYPLSLSLSLFLSSPKPTALSDLSLFLSSPKPTALSDLLSQIALPFSRSPGEDSACLGRPSGSARTCDAVTFLALSKTLEPSSKGFFFFFFFFSFPKQTLWLFPFRCVLSCGLWWDSATYSERRDALCFSQQSCRPEILIPSSSSPHLQPPFERTSHLSSDLETTRTPPSNRMASPRPKQSSYLTPPPDRPTTALTVETPQIHLVNRAGQARSPYVRAHADNLVAWQLWDDDMMRLARRSGRVVFLSIGYSGCHCESPLFDHVGRADQKKGCHVMARESFSNPAIARLLNAHFIPVKVDREQRPDLDRIYNTYVQATTSRGGWPLSVFLTPDLRPLFGGTYWPPGLARAPAAPTGPTGGATGGGTGNAAAGVGSVTMRPTHLSSSGPNAAVGLAAFGFEAVLAKMAHVWTTQRARCLAEADTVVDSLREFAHEGLVSREGLEATEDGDVLELDLLEQARAHLASKYDAEFGGFGLAGKFLVPAKLRFLLALGGMDRQVVRDVVGERDVQGAREMAVRTLRSMWRGGVKDQVGHGFARHSLQRDWSVPNFEKMLYDQAQLLNVYLDAYIVTRDAEFLDVAKDLIKYMTSPPLAKPGGGFFASEGSDSLPAAPSSSQQQRQQQEDQTSPIAIPHAAASAVGPSHRAPDVPAEGAYYVWTTRELSDVLGPTLGALFARRYSCSPHGNVPYDFDPADEFADQNVLSVSSSPADTLARLAHAGGYEGGAAGMRAVLAGARRRLREHRERTRERPTLDDKVVLAWNGLALGALARAGAVLAAVADDGEADEDAPFASNAAAAEAAARAAEAAYAFIRSEMWDPESGRLTRIWKDGGPVNRGLAFADDYAFLISGLLDLYEATGRSGILEWAEQLQGGSFCLHYKTALLTA